MKRTAALMIAFIMLLTILAGCGGENEKPDPTPDAADEATPAPTEEGGAMGALKKYPKQDLGGYEFMVRSFEDRFFTPRKITGPVTEDIRDRNNMLEEYFNCSIVRGDGDINLHWEQAQPVILGGDKWADLIAPTIWMMSFFYANDALLDLTKVPTMNLKADYYNQKAIDAGTKFDSVYIFSSDACSVDEFVSGIAFNKQIIAEKGLEDPYQLVRDNEWTIQKYREMARAVVEDLDGNGIMDKDDRWGHTGPVGDYEQGLYSGGGFPMIGRDKNGEYKIMLDKPEIRTFALEIKGLRNDDGSFFIKESQADWEQIYDVFCAGHCLFVGHRIWEFFHHMRDMEQDWGILPEPKMNREQKNYSGWVDHNAPILAIPKTTIEFEKAGLIIDAMSAMSHETLTDARYEEWGGLYFRDPENDVEMMRIIADSAYYDVSYYLRNAIRALYGPTDILFEAASANGDFGSAYERKAPNVQDAIDKFYKQGIYAE